MVNLGPSPSSSADVTGLLSAAGLGASDSAVVVVDSGGSGAGTLLEELERVEVGPYQALVARVFRG